MSGTALQVRGLTRRLQSFQLGPFDLDVDQGSIVALVGNNGSGKSTLFRLLTRLLAMDQGSIRFVSEGRVLEDKEAKQRIGYVGRTFGFFHNQSIDTLASFFAYWYPNWNQQKYEQLLERYQIDRKVSFAKCSTGTQKKVEFILALSSSPQWLLLDEPSSGLDLSSQKMLIEDMLAYMEEEQNSILISSHNLDEINRIADFIYLIDKGRVIHSFSKDEIHEKWSNVWIDQPLPAGISSHPAIIEQKSTQIVTNDLPELEKILNQEGITITHFQRLTLLEAMEHLLSDGSKEKE